MNDQITELRALLDDYDGNGMFVTPVENVSALLDCAEALRALLSYTKACEALLNAVPAGQIRTAEEALARLNGGTE